jgi:ADP-heptose:LPS heptosyltransferase
VVRLSALGDTVHALPLAAALKRSFPGCRLGWLVEQPSAPLIVGNPLVDWSRVLPRGWLKSPRLVRDLRRDLRRERFEAAFDVQGLTKSAAAAWLSGAKIRVGFARGWGRELAPLLDNRLVRPGERHVVRMNLSLLTALGVGPPENPEFVLPPCGEADAEAIGEALSGAGYAGGFVLLGPWTSIAAKCWPAERFLALARRLFAETGLPSLALGHGEGERRAVSGLAAQSGGALAPAPDLRLPGVAELARRARLFVGCDSFPLHVSAAAGCPSLGLFGVTDPLRVGPLGEQGDSVYEKLVLPGSTRRIARLNPDAMASLGVEKVLGRCRELLARSAGRFSRKGP